MIHSPGEIYFLMFCFNIFLRIQKNLY